MNYDIIQNKQKMMKTIEAASQQCGQTDDPYSVFPFTTIEAAKDCKRNPRKKKSPNALLQHYGKKKWEKKKLSWICLCKEVEKSDNASSCRHRGGSCRGGCRRCCCRRCSVDLFSCLAHFCDSEEGRRESDWMTFGELKEGEREMRESGGRGEKRERKGGMRELEKMGMHRRRRSKRRER